MHNLNVIHHVVIDRHAYTFTTLQVILVGVGALLELVLRCFALWKSARVRQMGWFVLIIVINSFGVLPLLYLLFVNKGSDNRVR